MPAVSTIAVLVLLGCSSPELSTSKRETLAGALQERISENEARKLFLEREARDIEVLSTRARSDPKIGDVVTALKRRYDHLSAELETFLSARATDDEIWWYRTYVTPDL